MGPSHMSPCPSLPVRLSPAGGLRGLGLLWTEQWLKVGPWRSNPTAETGS